MVIITGTLACLFAKANEILCQEYKDHRKLVSTEMLIPKETEKQYPGIRLTINKLKGSNSSLNDNNNKSLNKNKDRNKNKNRKIRKN